MVLWYQTVDPGIQPASPDKNWTVGEWKNVPLLIKIQYAAERMLAERAFQPFQPEDLAARIDDLIASGQAAKLQLQDVPSIIRLLEDTDAVRSGDFRKANSRYGDEVLPDLPIFQQSS
jgi:hypothetical protein